MANRLSPVTTEGPVPPGRPCPITTERSISLQEACGIDVPEVRAYKLGKKRWSYNQVEVVLMEAGGTRQLHVQQASSMAAQDDGQDGSVLYDIHLSNGLHVKLRAFLCYDHAEDVTVEPAADAEEEEDAATAAQYQWTQVDRCACKRGCTGPVMRSIQRYGKLGKRRWNGSLTPDVNDRTNHNMKDPRYLYLSFDEAGTHVGATYFRMVTAVYDESNQQLLGTAVTPPLRVVANNDVPTGAAHIQHLVSLPATWEGWTGVPEHPEVPVSLQPGTATSGETNHREQATPSQRGEAKPVRCSSRKRRPRTHSDSASVEDADVAEGSGSPANSHLPMGFHSPKRGGPSGVYNESPGSSTLVQTVEHHRPMYMNGPGGPSVMHPNRGMMNQSMQSYPQVIVQYVDPLQAFATTPIGYGNDLPSAMNFMPQQHTQTHYAPMPHQMPQSNGGDSEDPLVAFMELMLQMPDANAARAEGPVLELPDSPRRGQPGSLAPPQLYHQQQHAQLMQLWHEQNAKRARQEFNMTMNHTAFDSKPPPPKVLVASSGTSMDIVGKDQQVNNGAVNTPTPSMLDDLLVNLQNTLDGAAETLLLNDDASFGGLRGTGDASGGVNSSVFVR